MSEAALERLRRIGGARLVRDMIELYLAHGPERMRSLQAAAHADDAAGVERAAHTMKSSAGNLGAVAAQRAAEALEASAAAGAIDRELVARLVREYTASAEVLRRVLEERPT